MNLAGAGIDRRAVPVQHTRAAAGAYNDDGEWVPGAPANSTIRAVKQPASGRQLMDVPEGIRAEAQWFIWSRSELRIDDTVTFGGLSYRLVYVWARDEGGFYRGAMGELA